MKDGIENQPLRKRLEATLDAPDTAALWKARIYGAIQKRDAAALREFAKQVGKEKQDAAVPMLCDFLTPPTSRWKTPKGSKDGWPEARAAAVWALKEIGDPKTLPTLTATLLRDRDAMVRAAAVTAIESFRCDAIPAALSALSEQSNWNLHGMKALISCLSRTQDMSYEQKGVVLQALLDILRNKAPLASSRWKTTRLPPFLALAVFTGLAFVFFFGWNFTTFWFYLPVVVLSFKFAKFLAKDTPVRRTIHDHRERKGLHKAAASALLHLKDKRSVPSLITIAFDGPGASSRAVAQNVLAELLPMIEPSDTGLFSAASLDLLNTALLSPQQAGLTFAILHTLAAVGNENSVKSVKRLTRWGHSEQIVEEARRVLAILEQRRLQMQEARSLLRGSQPPATAPDQLLRPAASQESDSHREQLLRAAQNE